VQLGRRSLQLIPHGSGWDIKKNGKIRGKKRVSKKKKKKKKEHVEFGEESVGPKI